MFGQQHYGEIYGYVNLSVYLGAALSVPAIAVIYDRTGSYDIAWIICIVMIGLSLLALLYSNTQCRKLVREGSDLETGRGKVVVNNT